MLESCRRPDLVTEITLQPVRRHGVDAAILFSDIVVPVAAAGVDLDIVPGTGPVVAEPIRTAADVERLRAAGRRPTCPTSTRRSGCWSPSSGGTPLIGFAGAPFTLASYLVEGGPSRTHAKTKALMYGEPALWHALCERLAEITLEFLRVQVAAGVSAVQLFDSWAGALSEADYRRYVLPHSTNVLGGLADAGVPRIHFGVGTARAADRDGRGRRRRGGRRLAYAAGPGRRAGRGRPAPCRATWTRARCSRRGRWSRRRCAGCWPRAGPRRATSSTSATACCRRPTRTC